MMGDKSRNNSKALFIDEKSLIETYATVTIANNKLIHTSHSLTEEFFDQYVWWWRLLEKDIEDNYGSGSLTEYTDRLLDTVYFYQGLTDAERNRKMLHECIFNRLKEKIDWMRAPDGKFLLIRAFDYEAKSRVSYKYIQRWNCLTLSINTNISSDIARDEELKYRSFLPNDILRINPSENQEDAINHFKAWRKKGMEGRGLQTKLDKGEKKPIVMQKPSSWKPLEYADARKYSLYDGGLDDGARGQLSKLEDQFYCNIRVQLIHRYNVFS